VILEKKILLITLLLAVVVLASAASIILISSVTAQNTIPPFYGALTPYGWYGCPMCGGWWGRWYQPYPQYIVQRLDIQNVIERLEEYISRLGRFKISEVMEFTNNFYAIIIEEDTGMGAFELLVDPYSGVITPEPGPNMMWNLKYGMHNRMHNVWVPWWQVGPNSEMPISSEEAKEIAYSYLKSIYPTEDIEVEEPAKFYGYYTLDYELNGRIHGMLSVNGFTGEVWYHSWHREFIQEKELS
jgi:hypothetical protein